MKLPNLPRYPHESFVQYEPFEWQAAAYLEARKALRLASKQTAQMPEMWANLLGAVANLALASLPREVVVLAGELEEERERANDRIRQHLEDALNASS